METLLMAKVPDHFSTTTVSARGWLGDYGTGTQICPLSYLNACTAVLATMSFLDRGTDQVESTSIFWGELL